MKLLVKEYRKAAFLTQQELADKAGLTVWGIKKLEGSKSKQPRLSTIRRVADALGIPPANLVAPEG